MAEIHFVVAVDEDNGIGNEGRLLFHFQEDLKHFRELTENHIVIYGRKTLDTFPKQQLLGNRENWILTRNPDFIKDGATIFYSVEDVLEALNKRNGIAYVIGGESLYRQFLPYCEQIELTRVYAKRKADTYFEISAQFQCVKKSSRMTEDGVDFVFVTYRR